MEATIKIENTNYNLNLNEDIDISIPLQTGIQNPNAWYVAAPKIEAVQQKNWIGAVSKGASVNFNTITFNPHAHGTHTECIGHITPEFHNIQDSLSNFFFLAELISIKPEKQDTDWVITENQIRFFADKLKNKKAVIIRTLPNLNSKLNQQYNHTNWPYLEEAATKLLVNLGIDHLLIDTPSVDKEQDNGALLSHKAFWNYPENPRFNATITEFIYAKNSITDGSYLLNLQIASFVNDATPSKPILYKINVL